MLSWVALSREKIAYNLDNIQDALILYWELIDSFYFGHCYLIFLNPGFTLYDFNVTRQENKHDFTTRWLK